ncbi:2-oxoisovalerate dehydrogenase E1 component [Terrimicrobium sacchariphilum]|uniref:2-oxoisovalerate dehydrogenase E1 component n=1 Tax=Terrimicrobium sacchariphilum TaxID=690879 RepID=A0A146GDG4_TERSA|nr:pyruvate dehydrogenase complex E1 component subunit beta [Terrimicrobium sacchariphilum]GAT35182.1 2-oxoisovalerate dehydrogenase E1 component [Terrimicrobium sacchariphilum]
MNREDLLRLYERMVLLRQSELAAQAAYKKGEMPGFIHLYVGQEAVAVGLCAHLRNDDWITSTHRGHGHALAKGMPVKSLFAELFARSTGCCGGRGGSMHLYDPDHGVFGTNGIVGAGIPHAVGAALSARIRGTDGVGVAFFGDGAVNHGAFHESLNFAGAQGAGVVFVCENNLYATATPLHMATRNTDIASKAAAYGITGVSVDGNDVLAVWEMGRDAVLRARNGGGPTLIEARTYRFVGHHEGDPLVGTYRTQEELDGWKMRCPILRFRHRLSEEMQIATLAELDAIDLAVQEQVESGLEFARVSPEPLPETFSDHVWSARTFQAPSMERSSESRVTQGWLDAVRDGIAEEMRRDPHILYFGEGIGERAGSFAHTKGLWQEFGGHRVVDTPICELGFTGAAVGASATGCRTIADLMFVDFLFETGGQIPLQASKLRYMSNGQMSCPMVIRAPCGAIKSAGPHHSGTYHAPWSHFPGLIVAMPSNPADAKGLMKTALRSEDPVLFLEPKALFSSKGDVPVGEHLVPFGVASIRRSGCDATIVAAGRMVELALEAANRLEAIGVHCDVIDLRTIVPLDLEAISASLKKTHRVLVVDEGYAMCGVGAEIAAALGETAFDELDAPVGRLHLEPVSHPFSPKLENAVLPSTEKIVEAVRDLMAGRTPLIRRPQTSGVFTRKENLSSAVATNMESVSVSVGIPATDKVLPGMPVLMPHGDLTVSEARVVKWIKSQGDVVVAGEGLLEVETDKAVMEIEAPGNGRLIQVLAPVGTVVKMGETLGVVA